MFAAACCLLLSETQNVQSRDSIWPSCDYLSNVLHISRMGVRLCDTVTHKRLLEPHDQQQWRDSCMCVRARHNHHSHTRVQTTTPLAHKVRARPQPSLTHTHARKALVRTHARRPQPTIRKVGGKRRSGGRRWKNGFFGAITTGCMRPICTSKPNEK